MSDDGQRRRGRLSRYLNGGASLLANGPPQPGDEQTGEWSRQELERMDARFSAKLERAFSRGRERRASASSQVDVPTGPAPRLSSPLCPEVWTGLLRATAL